MISGDTVPIRRIPIIPPPLPEPQASVPRLDPNVLQILGPDLRVARLPAFVVAVARPLCRLQNSQAVVVPEGPEDLRTGTQGTSWTTTVAVSWNRGLGGPTGWTPRSRSGQGLLEKFRDCNYSLVTTTRVLAATSASSGTSSQRATMSKTSPRPRVISVPNSMRSAVPTALHDRMPGPEGAAMRHPIVARPRHRPGWGQGWAQPSEERNASGAPERPLTPPVGVMARPGTTRPDGRGIG